MNQLVTAVSTMHRVASQSVVRWLALLALLVVGWFVVGALGAAQLAVIILVLYYASAGASFNLLFGSLNVFSLAQPVFVAVGGFTAVYLYNAHGISPWIGVFVGMAVAGLLAVVIAFIAMRRPGTVVTALVTLIISEAAPPVFSAFKALGGSIGLYIPVKTGDDWSALQFSSGVPFARIFLVLNVLIIAGLMWFAGSRWGRWVTAIRDSTEAASACGIPVLRMRIGVFAASAMIAAVPGVLFAQYNLLVNADLFLGSTTLFQLIVVALVGGSGRPWGSLAGALVITELSYYLTRAAGGRPGIGPLTFAAAFLIMALLMPRGISGTWSRLVDSLSTRAGPDDVGAEGQVPAGVATSTLVPALPSTAAPTVPVGTGRAERTSPDEQT